MKLRIVFLKSAEQDLRELRVYIIRNFGKSTWQTSYTGIKDAVSAIRNFPLDGSLPEELEKLNLMQYRQVLTGMNRIIYEVRPETIYVHIICDTRKDMKTLLARRLLRAE